MKIFISWSGERSRQVAELLNEWLKCVIQAVDPWLSTRDIDKGSLWFNEISSSLSTTQNGIVCLTKSNVDKPWILFESGALAKGLATNKVFTFLVDMEPNEIKDPLAQFNHTLPTKSSVFQLIRSINNGLGDQSLKENILSNVFDTYWSQFESKFAKIISETPEEDIKIEISKEEILNEILYSVRGLEKRLRKIETNELVEKQKSAKSLVADKPIEDLDVSVRLFNFLKSENINRIKDILKIDRTKLDDNLRNELINIINSEISKISNEE